MNERFFIVGVISFLLLQMAFVYYYLHKITIKSEEEEERILQLEIRITKLYKLLKKLNK